MAVVLVVDDDAEIADLVQTALEEVGYTVLSSVDGAALQIAQDAHPDVILLDLMMPGMDGIAVSQRLRSDPKTAGIPIVVMSAQDRIQSLRGRMPLDDRLPKPFDLARLYAVVQRWAPRP